MAWLCDAGTTLRSQIDHRWPGRDKASDGWIGDAAHTTGDHVPDPTSEPPGVVRAIDVDADLVKGDREAMERLVGQLRRYCRDRLDHDRTWYIIFDGAIASKTYGWRWRPYSGTNPHTHHAHISFTVRGDHRGGQYALPIFTERRRLQRLVDNLTHRIEKLKRKRAKARNRLRVLA